MFVFANGIVRFMVVGFLILFFGSCRIAASSELSQYPPEEPTKIWQLAYYEGGNHKNYRDYLIATVNGLIKLGWIEPMDIPDIEDTKKLWFWLASNTKSNYVKFIENSYFSAHWDQGHRERDKRAIIQLLNRSENIDLIFAMGTWAGEDLANSEHNTPTFVISASDPVKSGIIISVENSGYDHLFARVSPQRYEKQIKLFHKLVKFKKLGVAYENTNNGRTYAAIESIEKVAKEKHFELVSCYTKSDISDQATANLTVISCIENLANKVDALYITMQGGVNEQTISEIVDIANKKQVATLSQLGVDEVKFGILMGVSTPGFDSVGLFLAASLGKVFNGANPGDLKQLFEEKNNISINLKTADIIGTYVYAEWLAVADKIYNQISLPGRERP